MGLLADVGFVDRFFDEGLHNECVMEYYAERGFDPRKTLMLYYDDCVNCFYEMDYNSEIGERLTPVHNIHQILEPWKVFLFKKNGECVFPDRSNSFLVELTWIPF